MSNETAIASLKEKIDDLNQHAWEVRVTDLPKSLELSQESVKLARSINYPKGLAEGLRSLGFSYVRYSKNDEAAPLLKESLSLFQSLNDLKGQAVIYEYLGIIERNWGNLGASLDLLLKAYELVLQTGPLEVEITCCYQLGVTYKHLGNHENALDYLYRTLSLAKKMNYPLMEAYATNIIGSIYFDNGNYDQALDCYQQGLIIRRQSHDKWGEAGSLDNIGFTYLKLNDLDKAIEYCKQSLTICQATDDKKGEANALLHLGEIYEQAGDIKQAAGFSNESLEIRKARGDKRGEIEVLLFLADLYKNRSDVEDHQIFEWLSAALKIADEIKAQDLLSKAYYSLHEYYQQKGNFKESLVQLEAHFQIEKELHKNSINQKIANLEISHKAEAVSQRNKELTELNEKIRKANEELKIEASLEKIRSRSLAMHKSDELKEVISVVFEKLKELGLVFDGAGIQLFTEGSRDTILWVAAPDQLSTPSLINLPYIKKDFEESEIIRDFWKAKQAGENIYCKTYSLEEKNRYFNYVGEHNDLINIPAHVREWQLQAPSYTATIAIEKNSALLIDSWSGQTISTTEFNVLNRVARVFEQAYTRFLDLQKAEAQARESQIELALERVRARTMAMQKSDELREAVLVIYEQLQQLNFESRACNIIIIDKESDSAQYWVSGFSQEIFPESYTVPYLDHPYQDALLKPWKQGDKYVVYEYTGKMKQSFDEIFFTQTEFRNIPEDAKKVMIGLKSVKLSTAFISYGALQSIGAEPLSEEKANILKRFAKVFEQTYTRFLDLQKAELQARESQIQLAMERVRARTMAMQKSDELPETSYLLFQQVKELGETTVQNSIGVVNEEAGFVELSTTVQGHHLPHTLNIPIDDPYVMAKAVAAWKAKRKSLKLEFEGQELKNYNEHRNSFFETKVNFPEDQWIVNIIFFSKGWLSFSSNKNISDETFDLLKRFAAVFEQTYTRFNDLKQAEEQAREAQIEAALERVRSRTMAMQHSGELKDAALLLFQQVQSFGVDQWACGYNIWEADGKTCTAWMSRQGNIQPPFKTHPAVDHCFQRFYDAKQRGESFYVEEIGGDEIKTHYKRLISLPEFKSAPKEFFDEFIAPEFQIFHIAYFDQGYLMFITYKPVPQTWDIFKRFAKVFEQTYTRFLDLQKAEEQSKESQIQLALERVRARTMAMQHSDELKDAAALLFQQVKSLGVPAYSCGYNIWEKDDKEFTSWMSTQDGSDFNGVPNISLTEDANFIRYVESKQNAEQFFVLELRSERMQEHYEYLKTIPAFKAYFDYAQSVGFDLPETQIHHLANFSQGNLLFITLEPCPEFHDVFKRFAAVFEQTYTRFLDLQKAEVQARESQIELGLERVRARAMAMQSSNELSDLVDTVFKELTKLDFALNWCIINIIDESTLSNMVWAANPDIHKAPDSYHMKFEDYPFHDAMMKGFKERKTKYIYVLEGNEKKVYDEYLFKETEFRRVPEAAQAASRSMEKYVVSFTFGNFGGLQTVGNEPLSDINLDILERFGKVFDLTYTRFNDLLKAEAQAREAQIEAGLERVRSRSLAMHNTSELQEVIHTVHKELLNLNIAINGGSFIAINKDVDTVLCCWGSGGTAETSEEVRIPLYDHPFCTNLINRIKSAPGFFTEEYTQKEKKDFFTFLFKHEPWSKLDAKQKDQTLSSSGGYTRSCYVSQHTSIFIINHFGKKFSAADNDILQRFGKVFEQAYTRFLDLQKAEAQAREARIEAALERVRAKAMAMHKSDDLTPAVATVFEELEKLNMGILRCGIAILDKEKPRGDIWVTVKSEQKSTIQLTGDEPMDYHPLLQSAYDAWLKQEDFSYILKGEELAGYYRAVTKVNFQLPISATFDAEIKDQKQFYYNAVFQDGSLFAFMETDAIDEAKLVVKRFANVFNLTYKRFLDLQKAEAQTHKANIETALERVRARALAMQQPEELIEVAEVLRHEMGLLGVEELETCSIYIHDETIQRTECWYALKDLRVAERKLVSDHFPLNLNDTWVGREMAKFYKSDAKQVSIIMQGANRKEWINYCEEKSVPFRGYYGKVIPDRTYHLYKFSHGAIGAASAGAISNESWELLSRASSVFSLAYSRFKDLTQARGDLIKLKEEKKRAEDALSNLQAAQKQLVQAEKMASLGELTAGIAHEIQNPLNFVNNFSDVSNELLEEMKAELEKGNAEEAKLIAVDVKENLEKILHHGKRADAIVKGMLQHSRTSTGQKEPTDINLLAEEYLRLAYHGLRAKDKFFNAKFETDLDPSITKISIVPQEIGRVILNLINNSFYAVTEKKRTVSNGYEPMVTVSTKAVKPPLGGLGVVEIRVVDNGNGIPQKVLDKIFQPFFTTKPTGQGTGLGLSLSYDIVTKGHNGEIKVETKEGEGSAFIISLPMK